MLLQLVQDAMYQAALTAAGIGLGAAGGYAIGWPMAKVVFAVDDLCWRLRYQRKQKKSVA